jgi:ABC-type uncharacterized transport system substrate-binding protein
MAQLVYCLVPLGSLLVGSEIVFGQKGGDLSIEQPRQFDLWINLKTAKQIGLAIPPSVLARAIG